MLSNLFPLLRKAHLKHDRLVPCIRQILGTRQSCQPCSDNGNFQRTLRPRHVDELLGEGCSFSLILGRFLQRRSGIVFSFPGCREIEDHGGSTIPPADPAAALSCTHQTCTFQLQAMVADIAIVVTTTLLVQEKDRSQIMTHDAYNVVSDTHCCPQCTHRRSRSRYESQRGLAS